MKLLAFSDLHTDTAGAKRLVERSADADVVIGAGDFASIHEGLEETIDVLRAIECPTVLVPLRLDGRGSELVVLRPVLSERAMTARPGWIGTACLSELRRDILRFDAVSGLAYDVTTKPPGTIEWE